MLKKEREWKNDTGRWEVIFDPILLIYNSSKTAQLAINYISRYEESSKHFLTILYAEYFRIIVINYLYKTNFDINLHKKYLKQNPDLVQE